MNDGEFLTFIVVIMFVIISVAGVITLRRDVNNIESRLEKIEKTLSGNLNI